MTMYREMDMPFWLKKAERGPASWPEAFPISGFLMWAERNPPGPGQHLRGQRAMA